MHANHTPDRIITSLELTVLDPHPAFTDPRYDDWPLLSEEEEATMNIASAMIRTRAQAARLVKRDRENAAALDALHGCAPFWVACPECGGRNPVCACCKGRSLVSPLYADQWARQGI